MTSMLAPFGALVWLRETVTWTHGRHTLCVLPAGTVGALGEERDDLVGVLWFAAWGSPRGYVRAYVPRRLVSAQWEVRDGNE